MSIKDVKTENYHLMFGDCLERLKEIPDGSVDMVLTDPPYQVTQNKWDKLIPFDDMWQELKRIIKPNGVVALFGIEPFSSALRMSNIKQYKYDWIWEKSQAKGFLNAWRQPMRNTEIISIFYKKQPNYYPILEDKNPSNIRPITPRTKLSNNYGSYGLEGRKCPADKTMPKTIIKFNNAQGGLHPTQKPVALLEYLIKTYTNEGETVLDFTCGSGSTGVACVNTNRKFLGIEMDEKYFDIAVKRIADNIK